MATLATPTALYSVPDEAIRGHDRRRARRGWGIVFIAWSLVGVSHALLWKLTSGFTVADLRWLLPATLLLSWFWAGLTPGVVALVGWLDRRQFGLGRRLATHTITGLIAALAATLVQRGLFAVASPNPPSTLAPYVLYWLDVHLITYATVAVVARALVLHRRYRERTTRMHLLEVELSRAQMQFLELQLQPHFLFNSLNTISELAHEAPEDAEAMLRQLHTLLRHSLERGDDEVSLDEELANLEPWCELQRTRFGAWLAVRLDVEPEARQALVPHFVLQPLVENAIRHGLARRAAPGTITIRARVERSRLLLEVADDGEGLSIAQSSFRPGIGLRNARNRLTQLYGTDFRFELRDGEPRGAVVDMEIPYRSRAELDDAPATDWSATGEWTADTPRLWSTPVSGTSIDSVRMAVAAQQGRVDGHAAADTPARGVRRAAAAIAHSPPGASPDAYAARSAPVAPVRVGRDSPRLTNLSWLAIAGVWIAFALFWVQQVYAVTVLSGEPANVWSIGIIEFTSAGIWALLTPVILLLARRLRITRSNWRSRVPIHLIAAALVALVHVALVRASGVIGSPPILSAPFFNSLLGNLFIYVAFLAWSHSRDFYAWYNARDVAASRLEAAIARSRYQALCVQVRPQFLLGTIDLLQRLVHEDVPRAERLITRLADVLRLTLDAAADRDTTLRREIQLLRAYVDAHRLGVRPSAALHERIPVELLDAAIPNRLLRTLADDLFGGTAGGVHLHLSADEPSGDRARLRLHATRPDGSPLVLAHAGWHDAVEAATVAERDGGVSLYFPDAVTAIVVLDVGEPGAVAAHQAPHMLAAQPA
jgi:sensor histidine kinase YesM